MMLSLLLLAQAAASAPAAALPAWKFAERTNAAGVRSVSASVAGYDGVSRLVVKCDVGQEPIVSIQFFQTAPLGQGEKPLGMRFDNGFANSYAWQSAGKGLYVSDPQAVTALTTLLVKAKAVNVETTNASNFAVQATFAAPGGDAMVRKVLGVCGYTLGVVPPLPPAPPIEEEEQ
jgi:hypothetical protein